MIAPVVSGRAWERVTPQPQLATGVNEPILVQDANETTVRAFFKWPTAGSPYGSPYSIGIERVYYELARRVGVPVCDTFLEQVEGYHGLVSMRAPGAKAWNVVEKDILESRAKFVDRGTWPIGVALDVLMGNTDRHYQPPDGEMAPIGSWSAAGVEQSSEPNAVSMLTFCRADDRETAELWRAELSAGRLPPPSPDNVL